MGRRSRRSIRWLSSAFRLGLIMIVLDPAREVNLARPERGACFSMAARARGAGARKKLGQRTAGRPGQGPALWAPARAAAASGP